MRLPIIKSKINYTKMLKNRGILPLKSVNEKFEPIIVKRKKTSLSPRKISTYDAVSPKNKRNDYKLESPINNLDFLDHNSEKNSSEIPLTILPKTISESPASTSADVPVSFADQFPPLCVKIENHDSFDEKICLSLENVNNFFFL